MLAKLTLYSTLERQPVDSQVETYASRSYLVNTDCITEMTDETTYRKIHYKFNPNEGKTTPFEFDVTNTASAITTLADATKQSEILTLKVFEDEHGNSIQSFNQASGLTSKTRYFNVDNVVWGEENPDATYTRIWVKAGGNKNIPLVIDYTITQIVNLTDTGATSA